jgi:hypothetical protein
MAEPLNPSRVPSSGWLESTYPLLECAYRSRLSNIAFHSPSDASHEDSGTACAGPASPAGTEDRPGRTAVLWTSLRR